MSLSMDANSLLLLPSGFSGFGKYSSLGLTHTAGTTLTIPAGANLTWSPYNSSTLNINDPVVCQGNLSTHWGPINFNNGLVLSGSGFVDLGGGSLTVNDTTSAITGGSL